MQDNILDHWRLDDVRDPFRRLGIKVKLSESWEEYGFEVVLADGDVPIRVESEGALFKVGRTLKKDLNEVRRNDVH